MKVKLFFLSLLLFSCTKKSPKVELPSSKKEAKVKVAAIQCSTRMGKIEHNRQLLTSLIQEAAAKGAKIIVLPEAAVSGYMDPATDTVWTKETPGEGELPVQSVAETVTGESVMHFSKLAAELKVYLTVPFIEKDKDHFYNSLVLLDPHGKTVGHHRKRALWNHGDSTWCTEGKLPPQVIETEYGRLGLMICYDVHVMPQLLTKEKTDIVLYSVGWYGPNTEDWYKNRFPRKYAVPGKFSVIAANWSHEPGKPGWEGCGWSNVLYKNGIVINITNRTSGSQIVYGKLPYKP